jgi:hypothetical protein
MKILSIIDLLGLNRDSYIIQCLTQQIAQSILNNHFSLMSLLHVWTSARSSSGRCIKRYTSTADYVKMCLVLQYEPCSSVDITTGWTVHGSNPGGGEIFRACPDRPWGPPSLLYNEYWVFPGGKVRPGCAADRSPPSSAVVMEE